MPDLATHVLATRLMSSLRPGGQGFNAALLVGAVLPDVVTRPFYSLFPELFWLFFPLHSPAGLLVLCYVLSLCVEERVRVMTFGAMLTGALFHLLLDLLQKSVTQAYALFFPFSWAQVHVGLFWPDYSLLAVLVLLGMNLCRRPPRHPSAWRQIHDAQE